MLLLLALCMSSHNGVTVAADLFSCGLFSVSVGNSYYIASNYRKINE
jgi:hypothetical protein